MGKLLTVSLYTTPGPGRASELVYETKLMSSIPTNGYPEVVVWKRRVFIATPMAGEYREVSELTTYL